jgi:hypothetical protein
VFNECKRCGKYLTTDDGIDAFFCGLCRDCWYKTWGYPEYSDNTVHPPKKEE